MTCQILSSRTLLLSESNVAPVEGHLAISGVIFGFHILQEAKDALDI